MGLLCCVSFDSPITIHHSHVICIFLWDPECFRVLLLISILNRLWEVESSERFDTFPATLHMHGYFWFCCCEWARIIVTEFKEPVLTDLLESASSTVDDPERQLGMCTYASSSTFASTPPLHLPSWVVLERQATAVVPQTPTN